MKKCTKLATGIQTTSLGCRYRLMWQQAVVLNVWITLLQLAVTESHGYQTSFTFSQLKCSEQILKNCPDHMPM